MPTPKPGPEVPANADDPAESQRFIDMAREIGVDESPDAFQRAFEKVIKSNRPQPDQPQPPEPRASTQGRPRRGQSH